MSTNTKNVYQYVEELCRQLKTVSYYIHTIGSIAVLDTLNASVFSRILYLSPLMCFSPLSSQSPVISRAQPQSEKKFDLLSDLGGDIFAAPPSQTAGSTSFANFAHFSRPSGVVVSVL